MLWLLITASCAVVGEAYRRPDVEISAAWSGAEGASYYSEAELDLGHWWERFEDQELNHLVECALAESLDLKAALASYRRSLAVRGQVTGNRYPDVDASGSYARQRTGANGALALPEPQTIDLWSGSLGATWEVDVWGRVTRLIEAANADLQASLEDLRDVRAVLVADVVSAYIDLRTGQARLQVARENIAIQERSFELTRVRAEAGAAPALDVAQARTNLANTEASLTLVQDAVRTAELRLGVLLGQDPSSFVREPLSGGTLPDVPESIAIGVPANLLRQRPDVRAAERAFAGEFARIGVEAADLYPRFSLIGSLGAESTSSGRLFDRESGIFQLGPSFDWNLFDGGRERGQVRAQREAAEAARLQYRQTVLLALEEVEGALYGLARDRERAAALQRSFEAARDSAVLSRELYLEGRSDFQNVLDSERSLFSTQDEWIVSRADLAQRYVFLLRALGGGWQPDLEDPETP